MALVRDTEVVQAIEFATDDPTMTGETMVSYLLADAGDGTELEARHENVPPGVSTGDNEFEWRMSLAKLADLVERG